MKLSTRIATTALASVLGFLPAAKAEDAASGLGTFAAPAAGISSKGVIAIRGAFLHPVIGPELEDATVLIENGKITGIGKGLPLPAGAEVLEAEGQHLYPGFIDGDTTLGLVEVPTIRGSVDLQETGRVNPDLRVEFAFNPSSHLIGVARAGGVTSAMVIPEGDLITGAAALMNLHGWTWEEMLVRSRVGIHLRFPRVPVEPPWRPQKKEDEAKKEREKQLKLLNRVFDDAEAYAKAVAAPPEAGATRKPVSVDRRLEALLPVLRGETPLIVSAPDLPAIKSALDWAEKRKVKIILRDSADAWRHAVELAKRKIPVLLPETLSLPERPDEPYDTTYTGPRVLHEAGVEFCFTSGGEASSLMNLPAQAAMAVAFGLDREAALEAITIVPARIFGVDARLGSVEVGKDANLLLTDGDPLEGRTRVVAEWIGGQRVDLQSKHVLLYELWKSRPRKP